MALCYNSVGPRAVGREEVCILVEMMRGTVLQRSSDVLTVLNSIPCGKKQFLRLKLLATGSTIQCACN